MNQSTITLNETTYKADAAAACTLKVNGKDYPSCRGCAFDTEFEACNEAKRLSPCVGEYRKDGKNIIWVKA